MREAAGRTGCWSFVTIMCLLGTLTGCPPPPLPPQDEVLRHLSRAVLDPNTSCEELRDAYGLVDLPVGDTPAELGLDYEEHRLQTPFGPVLRVWYLPAAAPRGVVIVSPGNTGAMQCYLFTARLLVQGGWDAVIYDYTGFGGSNGTPSLRTLRTDLLTVLDWSLERTGSAQASLYGLSLGSIASIAVAADRPAQVNGIILDSPVAMREEIERFDVFLRGRADEIIALLDPWLVTEEVIRGAPQPLLVYLHGQDIISPPRSVQALLDAAPGRKETVTFADLPHALGQFVETAVYDAALQRFLREVWRVEGAN